MRIGPADGLIDAASTAHVGESRAVYAARAASRGTEPPPDPRTVGSADILLGDNLVMAARLSAAGRHVDLRVYPESPHGFTLHPTAMARAALHDIEAWLADRFAEGARS